jgi:hypothetical protein
VRKLFSKIAKEELSAKVQVSYFEIYNENIIDLLSDKNEKNNYLEIREDVDKKMYLPGLTEMEVKTEKDALKIYEMG